MEKKNTDLQSNTFTAFPAQAPNCLHPVQVSAMEVSPNYEHFCPLSHLAVKVQAHIYWNVKDKFLYI